METLEELKTRINARVYDAYCEGQREMLKDSHMGRIESWIDESSNINLDDLRRMIRAVFAEERARLNDEQEKR